MTAFLLLFAAVGETAWANALYVVFTLTPGGFS